MRVALGAPQYQIVTPMPRCNSRGRKDNEMSRAVDYEKKYSMQELVDLQQKIMSDPKNKNTSGGIWIYKKSANKRIDDITRAISWKLERSKEINK